MKKDPTKKELIEEIIKHLEWLKKREYSPNISNMKGYYSLFKQHRTTVINGFIKYLKTL